MLRLHRLQYSNVDRACSAHRVYCLRPPGHCQRRTTYPTSRTAHLVVLPRSTSRRKYSRRNVVSGMPIVCNLVCAQYVNLDHPWRVLRSLSALYLSNSWYKPLPIVPQPRAPLGPPFTALLYQLSDLLPRVTLNLTPHCTESRPPENASCDARRHVSVRSQPSLIATDARASLRSHPFRVV
jgi:hypothetical protein